MAPSYYYAANQKVPISLDETQTAVDFARLESAPVRIRRWAEEHRSSAPLRGELRLIERSHVPDAVYEELDELSALHPVYRYGDTLLVVLPEVRVEASKAKQAKVRAYLQDSPVQAAIEPRDDDQLVLRPTSGKGADAIALANSVYEKVRPVMAQARFLQIAPDF